jgi:hypothetical protein
MKKLLSILLLFTIVIISRAQNTCATAINFSTTNSCNTGNVLTGTEIWFKFTGDSASVLIGALRSGGTTYLKKIEVYSGTCAGLTFKDSSTSYNDTTISLRVSSIVASTQYYIKVVKFGTGTCNFDMCMKNSFPPPACTPTCGQVPNESFETHSIVHSLSPFEYSEVNCWYRAGGTPQIGSGGGGSSSSTYFTHLQTSAGASSAEAIFAAVNVISGHTYALHYFIRKAAVGPSVVDNFYIKLVNSSAGGWTPSSLMTVIVPTSFQTIAHNTAITNTSWTEYSICFTATDNFDVIYVHPEANSGATAQQWLDADQIQVTELTANAGSDLSFTSCPSSGTLGVTSCNPIPGVTYSWSPTVGLSSPASYTTTVNPVSSSQTYTLTASIGGCSVTDAVVVSNSGVCSGSLVISTANSNTTYSVNTTISASTVMVNDNIGVTGGTLTITSDDVRFLTNVEIRVSAGATLIIDAAWLHACSPCGGMWNGILLDPGANLQIINGSVVEDAINGVRTTAGSTAPTYTINKAIFNKNTNAINIAANANDMSGNVIKNTLFTSRTLPDPNVAGFATNFSNIKNAMLANTLSAYPKTITLAGVRAKIGVEFTSITHTTAYAKVGATTTVSECNIFDNLDYGVYLVNSMCDIKNSTFQNMLGVQPFCIGCANYPTGVGIFAPTQTTTPTTNQLIVGGTGGFTDPCSFIDCFRGAEINTYSAVTFESNSFQCNSTPTSVSSSVPSAGSNGVFLKNIKETAHVNYNIFNNIITELLVQRNTSTGGLNPGEIIIDGNEFSADANGYCTQAASLTDISTNTITTVQKIYIRNNLIEYTNSGIKLSYIKNNPIIYDNNVILRYNSSGIYSGVMVEGCDLAEIKNNEISTQQTTYGTGNWEVRGVYVKTSTNNKVYCNTLYSLGQCMVFEGTCTSATASGYGIKANYMDNSRTGLMLRTNGIIGIQGSSSSPNGNSWNNSFTFDQGRTYAYNTSGAANVNTASILWCTAGGSTYPPFTPTNTNITNSGSGAEYTATGLQTATSGSAISCPTTELPSGLTATTSLYRTMEDDDYASQLVQLLAGTEDNEGSFTAQQWSVRNFIYNEVLTNVALQSDSTLNVFYTENQNTSLGLFRAINDAIETGDYEQATLLNNMVSADIPVEENQKNFNSIYLSHSDSLVTSYTETNIDELYLIANQCALEGGNAVYQSRNLLQSIENRVIEFSDSCETESINKKSIKMIDNIPLKLYPNPSSGNIILECNLSEQSAELIIYSLTGEPKIKYFIPSGTKIMNINAESLQAGMYLYELNVNEKPQQKNKLTIIK